MRRLKPYEHAPIADLDAIVASKRDAQIRAALVRLRPLIERLYDRYARNKKRLAIMRPHRPLASSDAEALLHCYESPTDALDALTEKIRLAQPKEIRWECQYCGLNQSRTWDHYLPKAEFPEFAVYAPNLVPCCHDCNTIRKTWVDGGVLTSVNLYYDPIDPRRPMVRALITITGGEPTVTFSLIKGRVKRTVLGRRFARHWSALLLCERFLQRAGRILSTLAFDIQARSRRQSAEEILEDLRAIADRKLRSLGPNHIESLIYRAASNSRALVDLYLQGISQPTQAGAGTGSGASSGGPP